MAKDKTTTIIFKGEDQISPAIKNATNAVAGLSTSFTGVQDSANQTTVQLRNGLLKTADLLRAELQKLSQLKITPEIQLKQQQILGQLKATEAELRKLDKLVVEPKVKFEGLKNAFTEIKTGISREIGAQIAQGLAAIPSAVAATTLEFEKLQTTLKSTLGSQSAADEAFARIKAFASETPFQVSEITESFIKLQNRGISPTTPLLRQLGDIASSQGKNLNQITEAILDASTGEFERLKEFGIQASKSGDQVTIAFKGISKTVANTPESINKAVASLGDLQGVSGGMEAQSKTLGGALSNLQDTADTLSVAFGEGLTPVLLEIVKGFSSSLGESENLARTLGQDLGNAIKFLVDNGETLKLILEIIAIRFGLVKLQAAAAAISTAASGAAAATAATGFTGLALATTATLAPLALLGAAIGLIKLTKATAELSDFNKELDATIGNSVDAGNNATRLADRLKNLANERKKGGVVTDEQIKKEKSFLSLADQEIETQKRLLEEAKKLKPADEAQRNSQAALIAGYEISIKQLEGQKKALNESIAASKAKTESNKATARSEDEIRNAVDRRIKNEQAANEKSARLRSKQFEDTTKRDTRTFEREAETQKRAFEKSLNEEQRAFNDSQQADKDQFEKQILAEQRAFNEGEKAKDADFQKSRQAQEKAFNEQQQLAKAAFDAKQQQASRDFDAKQNAEKEAADSKFAQRRVEIERQLQLEAAKTPEDRAKLETEFKAADEKAKKEKEAFAQLKIEEEAFAAKQKADKEAFDAKQKADQIAFEEAQNAAKLAFDDALKVRDVAFEQQKEAAKLAFEDTLKAKRDALEAGQEAKKIAFEDAQNAKKVAFDDAQQLKKDAFEQSINDKKAAFEETERTKKAAFEDSLKSLEAQFKQQERDKDIATAKQVAAIKSGVTTSAPTGLNAAIGVGTVKPLATGGRFNQGAQLLVGEKGAELVTFGSSGFVNNATNTKQALAANTAPSTMSTARMEALLTQLVGKLDRPNIAVQTSENPSDVVVKVQREIARAAAIGI